MPKIHDFLTVIWYLPESTNMLSEQQILLGHLYFRKSTIFPFYTRLLENLNRNSGAVVAPVADIHRPYQKKCIPKMCTNALCYSEGEKIQQSNRSVALLFKVQLVFWIKRTSSCAWKIYPGTLGRRKMIVTNRKELERISPVSCSGLPQGFLPFSSRHQWWWAASPMSVLWQSVAAWMG